MVAIRLVHDSKCSYKWLVEGRNMRREHLSISSKTMEILYIGMPLKHQGLGIESKHFLCLRHFSIYQQKCERLNILTIKTRTSTGSRRSNQKAS